jgi:hypothetical protein
MILPRFITGEDFYVGSIITPDGYQYYYGDKLPDNFIAIVDLATAKRDVERLKFASKVLDGAVYSPGDVLSFSPFPAVKYTSIENARKMADNAYMYPCSILDYLGAKYIKYTNLGTMIYDLYGDYHYCTPLGIDVASDINSNYTGYYSACLFKTKNIPIIIKNGSVYYQGKVVVPKLSFDGFISGDPNILLSYEFMFNVLCAISRLPKS